MRNTETRFVIETDQTTYNWNLDSLTFFRSNNILIGRLREKASCRYYHLKDLSQTYSVLLILRDRVGHEKYPLPPILSERLAGFLHGEGYDQNRADCGYFVHYMNRIPYDGHIDTELWNFKPYISDEELITGDTILMSERIGNETYPKHMAIYLSDGLFLSKFGIGRGNNLIVTTVEEMAAAFGGSYVSIMLPKVSQ